MQVPLLAKEVKGLEMLVELGESIYGDGKPVADQMAVAYAAD